MSAMKEEVAEFLLHVNYSEEKLLKELEKLRRKDIKIVLCLCSLDEIERVYGVSSIANMDSLRS